MGKTKRGHNNKKDPAKVKGKRRGRQKSLTFDGGDLDSQLRDLKLCTKDISGDGNCLFRALSDQYYGHDTQYAKIRKEVCEFLKENEDEYKFFVEDDHTFEYHMDCMEDDGTFGGNMELAAFARMRQVDIKVYQPGLIYVIRGVDEGEDPESVLHIAYHSWEHYSSVRNIDGPFTGPPVVMAQETKPKEGEEEESDDQLDSKEKVVLNACPDVNVRKIRRLLRKHKGNPNKVIDELFEPINEEPAKDESIKEESIKEEPLEEEPVNKEPVNKEPVNKEQVNKEQVKEESVKEKPVKEKPIEEEPNENEPVKKEPVRKDPIKKESVKEDSEDKELVKEEPFKDEIASEGLAEDEATEEKATKEGSGKGSITIDGQSNEHPGFKEAEANRKGAVTKPKKVKAPKKLTKQQKKVLQKKQRNEKWRTQHGRKADNDEKPSITSSMKEMYI